MVDTCKRTKQVLVGRAHREFSALITYLEKLTSHPDPSVATAALVVVRRIHSETDLIDARSFEKVYGEVHRQGRKLAWQHRAREWRRVQDLSVRIFHTLLRRFRREARQRHAARLRNAVLETRFDCAELPADAPMLAP